MKSRALALLLFMALNFRLSAQQMLPVTMPPSASVDSPAAVSLNGTWKFLMLPSLESDIPEGWTTCEFEDNGWG